MLVSRSRTDLFKDILSDDVIEFSGYDLTNSSCIEPLKKMQMLFLMGRLMLLLQPVFFGITFPFEEIPFDEAIEITRSHYATVHCSALITLPLLRERRGGKLITFSCNSVRHAYPRMSSFTVGKAAVETLTQCLAHEYAQYKITANCLRLASIATKDVIDSKPYGDSEHYLKVEELANIICSLCESPNTYINGSILELYEYSPSFYGKGYLERIRKK